MMLMMTWHFTEEIEHKAVSVDTARATGGGEFLRIGTMILVAPALYLFHDRNDIPARPGRTVVSMADTPGCVGSLIQQS